MEYLTLFYVFFKIGLFTFGGGYAMIPMIEDEVVGRGWLTAGELLNFIGVAESTPGPIAVNIATFIGSSRAGFLGALCATVGVVLPSFLIILLIAAVFRNFLKNRVVKGALVGIRGVIVGLILATGLWMALQVVLFTGADGAFAFDWKALVIGIVLVGVSVFIKKVLKRPSMPILMIVISAACGMILYSI